MVQVLNPKGNEPKTKVGLSEDVWRELTEFVREENARSAIARVSLRSVVNAAVREFVARERARRVSP